MDPYRNEIPETNEDLAVYITIGLIAITAIILTLLGVFYVPEGVPL